MKKQKGLALILAMVICLGLYSLCVFLIAKERTSALWIAYSFTVLAIVIEFAVPLVRGTDPTREKVLILGLSQVVFTTVYVLAQIVVGALLMITKAGTTVTIILCAIILSVYLLTTLAFVMGSSHVADVETKVKTSTGSIKAMVDMAALLYNTEKEGEKKAILKKVYEALRYSDPMSTTAEIQALDASIMAELIQLRDGIQDCSVDTLAREAERIDTAVQERNILCKSSK